MNWPDYYSTVDETRKAAHALKFELNTPSEPCSLWKRTRAGVQFYGAFKDPHCAETHARGLGQIEAFYIYRYDPQLPKLQSVRAL